MAQIDLGAGNLAARVARGRSATISVEGMQFLKPVHVEAGRRSRDGDESVKVAHASFTFVALDMAGRPRPIPTAAQG